jgi:saccharopine dehydrogenase (NADP+, L-glutamate forming)
MQHRNLSSSFVVTGENSTNTAMSKTVGLPLGIAAKLYLTGKLKLSGVHIPTSKAIYEPVLRELAEFGIRTTEKMLE